MLVLRTPASQDQRLAQLGAEQIQIEAVNRFAAEHGFTVEQIHRAARCITLQGRCGDLARVFHANLERRVWKGRTYRMRQGFLKIPAELTGAVSAVLGFDERPVAATDRCFHRKPVSARAFAPTELAHIYNFPKGTGKGQTIALIELGGGYRESDLDGYWKQLGLDPVSVAAVSVMGGTNSPAGDPNSADGEVVLDIQVAGAIAPGANIVVYFAPNTDTGFLAAVNAAIHNSVHKPSVISISWGAAEKEWMPQTMDAFNEAFHDAALLGITVCVAAGDDGSSDGESDSGNHVDFPASSPWVLACGGTRLLWDGDARTETVWNNGAGNSSTGGGMSLHFAVPAYQKGLKISHTPVKTNLIGRGVPDVAGVADPETGYKVYVDGVANVVGGTSAVAPLWGGLLALCNEQAGRNFGFLNPTLYGTVQQHKVLHDITSGNNGAYHATSGWDPCTGLGTPNGTAMLTLLKQLHERA